MSGEHDDRISRQEERFLRILSAIDTNLLKRQSRMQITPEIWEIERNLEYIRDQIEVFEAEAERLKQEISVFGEAEFETLRSQITNLEEERRIVVGPLTPGSLEVQEYTLSETVTTLPQLESQILKIENKILFLKNQIHDRESSCSSLQDIAAIAEKAVIDLSNRRSILENEIQSIAITRDLLAGVLPADIDPAELASIQNDLYTRFDVYFRNINENMKYIISDTKVLQTKIETYQETIDVLVNNKKKLTRQILDLDQKIDNRHASVEILTAEVAELSLSLEEHTSAISMASQASIKCEKEAAELNRILAEIETQLSQKRKHLDALKAVQKTSVHGSNNLATATAELLNRSVVLDSERNLQKVLHHEARLLAERMGQKQVSRNALCEQWRQVTISFDHVVAEWREAWRFRESPENL